MKRYLSLGIGGIIILLAFLIALPVIAHAAPDLTVTSISVSPANVRVNQITTIAATVRNIGDATATGANVYFNITRGTSTITEQNFSGIALDPNEAQTVTLSWTPFATGNHTVNVTAFAPSDTNYANDFATVNVEVNSMGTIQITNLFATPALVVDANGCASIVPLKVSGFVKEDAVGTNDGVLIYVNNDLYNFVHANSAQSGYFEANISEVCFDVPGSYTVTAKVDRGSGAVITASATIEVLFTSINESTGQISGSGIVDVEATPRILRAGAGEFREFLISVKNLGSATDTYTLKTASASASQWLDLERSAVTVRPGQTVYVSLFIDMPRNVTAGSYPINIIAQGMSTDIERVYLVIENGAVPATTSTGGVSYSQYNYVVDVEAKPASLTIDAGEGNQYIVTVQNLGKQTDTYDLEIIANSKIKGWFNFRNRQITLTPGEKQDIILYVDVPDEAASKSYSVGILADGNSIDIERVALTTVKRSNFYDVEVGKLKISPEKVGSTKVQTVSVSAGVSFVDLSGESAGESVLTKLYVSGQAVQIKNVFIPSGETKTVTFNLITDSAPINSEAGTYDIYIVGTKDEEVDRSMPVTLTVAKSGAVTITNINTAEVNTSANKEASLILSIKNSDVEENTYTVSAESPAIPAGKIEVTPSTINAAADEIKTQEFKLKIGNVADGNYSVVVKVSSAKGVIDTRTITANVKGGQVVEPVPSTTPQTSGEGGGGISTAYLVLGLGGTLGAILGAVILAIIFAYYYQTTTELEVLGKKAKAQKEGGEAAIKEAFEEEKEAKAPIVLKTKPKEKIIIWEGEHFEKERAIAEKPQGDWTVVHSKNVLAKRAKEATAEKPLSDWTAEHAENVLINLEKIRDDFKQTLDDAGRIKKKLSGLASETAYSLKEKVGQIKETAPNVSEPQQKTVEETTNVKTGNGYVDRVVETI